MADSTTPEKESKTGSMIVWGAGLIALVWGLDRVLSKPRAVLNNRGRGKRRKR